MELKSDKIQTNQLRDPGKNRKVKFTKSMMSKLVEIVCAEGKQRIRFTDSMMPGLKAVVSETGSIFFYHLFRLHLEDIIF